MCRLALCTSFQPQFLDRFVAPEAERAQAQMMVSFAGAVSLVAFSPLSRASWSLSP